MRLFLIVPPLLLAACSGSGSYDEPRLATEPTLHLAKMALQQHNPQLALKVSGNILSHQPRNADALTTHGDAYFELGQRALATHDYELALKYDSVQVDALNGMGRVRMLADPAAAEEYFRRALDNQPRNATAWNNLGIACDLQNRHADAQAAYRHAIALEPTNGATQVNLGLSLAMSGDKAGALEVLQPLAIDPATARTLRQNLVTALKAAGDPVGAARVAAVDAQGPEAP